MKKHYWLCGLFILPFAHNSLAESSLNPIVREVGTVEGKISILVSRRSLSLTFSHRDMGRNVDCFGVFSTTIIGGDNRHLKKNIPFEFTNVLPTETRSFKFGEDVITKILNKTPENQKDTVKFHKGEGMNEITFANCYYGPPVEDIRIFEKVDKRVALYVHDRALHLAFNNKKHSAFENHRCSFGITAALLGSTNPDVPLKLKMTSGRVKPLGLTYVSSGSLELRARENTENRNLSFDYRKNHTSFSNMYCWRGGSSQFETTFSSDFLLTPIGDRVIWYHPNKPQAIVSIIESEAEKDSIPSSPKGEWQETSYSRDYKKFAVAKPGAVSIYDSDKLKEIRTIKAPPNTSGISYDSGLKLIVIGNKVLHSITGKTLFTFGNDLISHAFSGDGKHLIATFDTDQDSTISFPIGKWNQGVAHNNFNKPQNVTAIPGSNRYLLSTDKFLYRFIGGKNGNQDKSYRFDSKIIDIAISKSGTAIAVLEANKITLLNQADFKELTSISYTGTGTTVKIAGANNGIIVGLKRRLVRKNLVDFWTVPLP